MENINATQGTGVRRISQGNHFVAGGLASAKERARVSGKPNPAASTAFSNPLATAHLTAQVETRGFA